MPVCSTFFSVLYSLPVGHNSRGRDNHTHIIVEHGERAVPQGKRTATELALAVISWATWVLVSPAVSHYDHSFCRHSVSWGLALGCRQWYSVKAPHQSHQWIPLNSWQSGNGSLVDSDSYHCVYIWTYLKFKNPLIKNIIYILFIYFIY